MASANFATGGFSLSQSAWRRPHWQGLALSLRDRSPTKAEALQYLWGSHFWQQGGFLCTPHRHWRLKRRLMSLTGAATCGKDDFAATLQLKTLAQHLHLKLLCWLFLILQAVQMGYAAAPATWAQASSSRQSVCWCDVSPWLPWSCYPQSPAVGQLGSYSLLLEIQRHLI